jgi:hypothetical protein
MRSEIRWYIFAQTSYNLFSVHATLTDTYLLLSQADLTLVTLLVTCMADAMTTVYFCSSELHKQQLLESSLREKAVLPPAARLGAPRGLRNL